MNLYDNACWHVLVALVIVVTLHCMLLFAEETDEKLPYSGCTIFERQTLSSSDQTKVSSCSKKIERGHSEDDR